MKKIFFYLTTILNISSTSFAIGEEFKSNNNYFDQSRNIFFNMNNNNMYGDINIVCADSKTENKGFSFGENLKVEKEKPYALHKNIYKAKILNAIQEFADGIYETTNTVIDLIVREDLVKQAISPNTTLAFEGMETDYLRSLLLTACRNLIKKNNDHLNYRKIESYILSMPNLEVIGFRKALKSLYKEKGSYSTIFNTRKIIITGHKFQNLKSISLNDFKNLKELSIFNNPIEVIESEKSNNLTDLTVHDTQLKEFSSKGFEKLIYCNFKGNPIKLKDINTSNFQKNIGLYYDGELISLENSYEDIILGQIFSTKMCQIQ